MTKSKPKNETVRSHYLPKTYLKHFLLDDKLFMYKKGGKFFKEGVDAQQRLYEISTENALVNFGLENDLYNPGVDGVSTDDLEEVFREYGENFYDSLVKDIETAKIGSMVTQDMKNKLAIFIAAMRVRTPLFKDEVEKMDTALRKHHIKRKFGNMTDEEFNKFQRDSGKDSSIDPQKFRDLANGEKGYRLEFKYPSGFFLKIALSEIEHHVDIFRNMTFVIYKSDQRYFVTSDNPVAYFVPPERIDAYTSPRSLISPYTELYFPITKNIGVFLSRRRQPEEILGANREIVDTFNYNISHHSFNFIFSPMKMNDLNKFIEKHIPYPFKFTIH